MGLLRFHQRISWRHVVQSKYASSEALRMVEIPEEILWICEAAHVPVVWATQVLENMVKGGNPITR